MHRYDELDRYDDVLKIGEMSLKKRQKITFITHITFITLHKITFISFEDMTRKRGRTTLPHTQQ